MKLLPVLCIIGCAFALQFDSVNRTLDLKTNIVRETIVLTLSGGPASSFDAVTKSNVGYIAASQGEQRLKVSSKTSNNGLTHTITLAKALDSTGSATVTVNIAYVNALRPFPASIETQNDRQLVEFKGNLHFQTEYEIEKETLTVLLASSHVESKTEHSSVKVDGEKITYGPFSDVAPLSTAELKVHYRNEAPFVVADKLKRIVDVSSGWGISTIEEHYAIHHNGAILKGQFSRLDAQRSPPPSMVSTVKATLPRDASNIYYRDQIGNISTSNVEVADNGVIVAFQPRFPLFGGWKTEFYFGYDLPQAQILKYENGKYVVRFPYRSELENVIVTDAEYTVILPSGAGKYSVTVNGQAVQSTETVTRYWNNWVGRTTVTFKGSNVVGPDNADLVEITY